MPHDLDQASPAARRLPSPDKADERAVRLLAADALAFAPASYDRAAGTVEVVWSTGAGVRRYDWETGGFYIEELDLAGAALARLNAGAPLLADHENTLASLIGSVVPGSARVQSGKGLALVRFDRTSESGRAAEAKVADGHLRHVSISYRVTTWQKIEAQGQPRRWIARAWEPLEVSFVPVPADASAGTRGIHTPSFTTRDAPRPEHQESSMTTTTALEAPPAAAPNDAEARAERARAKNIRERARALRLPDSLADELVDAGASVEAASARFVDAMAAREVPAPGGPRVQMGLDTMSGMVAAMGEAIACRVTNAKPSAAAAQFMTYRMSDIAGALLEAGGVNVRGMAPHQVVQLALQPTAARSHTTSDFPQLLQGAGQRMLLAAFEPAASGLRRICRPRPATDFRDLKAIRFAGVDELKKVVESGQVTHGTGEESVETYRVSTYARLFQMTREAIVNDDLSAFSGLNVLGRAAANTEAVVLLALLMENTGAGPTMTDGSALFTTGRGNLASSGTVLDVTNLSVARAAMRVQTDLNGVTVSNTPRFLVVGPAKETSAEQVVAAITPADASDVNPFAGKLEVVVEPRLTGNAWYLFADPGLSPVIEMATLGGTGGMPQIESFTQPNFLGVTMRVVHDFGFGAVSPIGAYRNAGA